MKSIFLLCLVFCIALVTPGYGAQTDSGLKDIPLEWKPTDAISTYGAIDLTAYHNVQFVIKPFTDLRTQPAEIGINTEKRFSDQDILVSTKQSVADWLTDKFVKVTSQFGIDAGTDKRTFFIDATVMKFFVTESSAYNAEVSLKVMLKAKSGEVVWEGITSGSATRFGRSAKAENYYEALSNATISAVHGLLNDISFKQAVQKNK
jgi:hypothetical protein